ncbi:unnamed protein product [Linum trigynum]|uniref:Uncharacterized protein n=1 Tax=Linum trigynum TaxID=586398 RepID=A0AAV2DV58_9ROSI
MLIYAMRILDTTTSCHIYQRPPPGKSLKTHASCLRARLEDSRLRAMLSPENASRLRAMHSTGKAHASNLRVRLEDSRVRAMLLMRNDFRFRATHPSGIDSCLPPPGKAKIPPPSDASFGD